jgi:hypothetical protein
MAVSTLSPVGTEPKIVNRWIQMIAAIVAMMAIANLQYWPRCKLHLLHSYSLKPGWCRSRAT